MDVNNKLSGISTATPKTTSATTTKKQQNTTTEKTDTVDNSKAYQVEISGKEETGKTEKYAVNQKEFARMIEENERKSQQLINLVNSLFDKQAEKNSFASFADLSEAIKNGSVQVDPETVAKAKEDIAEGGYYSVGKTSDRLVDFAKAISGGNPDKIGEMRDAVIKGFEEAEKAWGGKLPQISKDTFNATMDKFDSWAQESGVTLEEVERL